jgi:hypothetical protein
MVPLDRTHPRRPRNLVHGRGRPISEQLTGRDVVTSDGVLLGRVAAVRGRYLCVQPAGAPGFWLSIDSIRSNVGPRVLLGITAAGLPRYREEPPPPRESTPATPERERITR